MDIRKDCSLKRTHACIKLIPYLHIHKYIHNPLYFSSSLVINLSLDDENWYVYLHYFSSQKSPEAQRISMDKDQVVVVAVFAVRIHKANSTSLAMISWD